MGMTEAAAGRYAVKFVGNSSADGHTTYFIKVTGPDEESWNLKKRYKELRDLHDQLRFRYSDSLPPFPGKRLWGNQDPAFIASRQVALQQYLDGVLKLEREVRTPALLQFLGAPLQHGEHNQAQQYQQILDAMQSKL